MFKNDTDLDHYDGKRFSKAKGIEVSGGSNGQPVQLWQVNSKGDESRCYLSVPVDQVDEVCQALQEYAFHANKQPLLDCTKLPVKPFKFQVEVEDVPYNKDTYQDLYGVDAGFMDDYPENVCATEVMYEMVKDAICEVLEAKMRFIVQHKIQDVDTLTGQDKMFWDYLCRKEDRYRKIEATIKPVS